MKRPSREDYQRAVALARAAIRAHKELPRIRADRSPQAVLSKMVAMHAKGETLTEAILSEMHAALAEQESRKQRKPGRPKGTRDYAAHGALQASIRAVHEADLLNPYRNPIGPRLSCCDAVSDAMKAEGFSWMNSYDAACNEMKAYRRFVRNGYRIKFLTNEFFKPVQTLSFRLTEIFGEFAVSNALALDGLKRALEASDQLSKALRPMGGQMQESGRAFAALGERIRAGSHIDALHRSTKNIIKTMR